MSVIGVDPGLSGALAYYRPEDGTLLVIDMPTIPKPRGGREIDCWGLIAWLSAHEGATVWCEEVHAQPGNGVKAAFAYGLGIGALKCAIAAAKRPVRFVTPQKWKRHHRLSRDKDVARGEAMRRFPEHAALFSRKKDDGRAEAALIALYGVEGTAC